MGSVLDNSNESNTNSSTSPSSVPDHLEFDGQQADEQVLYVARLHWSRRIIAIAKTLFYAIGFFGVMSLVPQRFIPVDPRSYTVFLSIIALLFVVVRTWYTEHYMSIFKTVITDRRMVRIEFAPPIFKKKRALFWNEVAKVKTTSPSMFFSLMKVGTVTVQPLMVPNEAIEIPYVYYFGDLANYIEKILYLQKNKPEEIGSMRPFVTKPKGQRW